MEKPRLQDFGLTEADIKTYEKQIADYNAAYNAAMQKRLTTYMIIFGCVFVPMMGLITAGIICMINGLISIGMILVIVGACVAIYVLALHRKIEFLKKYLQWQDALQKYNAQQKLAEHRKTFGWHAQVDKSQPVSSDSRTAAQVKTIRPTDSMRTSAEKTKSHISIASTPYVDTSVEPEGEYFGSKRQLGVDICLYKSKSGYLRLNALRLPQNKGVAFAAESICKGNGSARLADAYAAYLNGDG